MIHVATLHGIAQLNRRNMPPGSLARVVDEARTSASACS